jgi:ubiquinone/menaquinone biosynthesis C-methylase UbiE
MWTQHQIENVDVFALGHSRHDAIYKLLRRFVPQGRVLEIGFGDGYLLRKLSAHYESHGADISKENVAQMQEKVPDARFAVMGTDGTLPYPDGHFDGFVASEVLEHMDEEGLRTAVAEIARVLKPGGHAVVTFPAHENLRENECFCPHCGHAFHKWGHKQSWDRKKIAAVFADLTIVSVSEKYFLNAGLNLAGKVQALLKSAALRFREVSGATFMVVLRK